MHRIRNLTNSPHKIKLADGSEGRVPARGEVELDVHTKWLPHYRRSGYLQVSEAEAAKPEPEDEDIDTLRAEYKELTGEDADGRWGEKRLREEIDAALAR